MTRTIKTNPAYAYLAYRRSILKEVIAYLQNDFLGATGSIPKKKIISDEVMHADAEVPREEIEQFTSELIQKDTYLELEMAKFEFRKKEENVEKAEQGPVSPPQAGNPQSSQN